MKKFYTWISASNRLFWEKVVLSTYLDAKSISAFRIVAGVFLLAVYMPNFGWIADIPKTFFNPPVFSLANFFDSFPGETFFLVLDCLVLLSLICVTLGVKARISALVYLVVCLVGINFQYSFGKISHVILAYLMMGCMAFSGWGRHLALWPDKESKVDNTAKSLSLFSVLICFGMFTAGFEKALVWLDFDLSLNGFLAWSQEGVFNANKDYLFAPYVKYFPVLLLESFDYTAVVFELSPLLFLLHSRKIWKIWLLVACTFHLTNVLLLNIPFPLHIIVYLAFVDFTWLYRKLQYYLSQFYFKCMATGIIFLIILMRCIHLISDQSIVSVFFERDEIVLLNLYFSLVGWCIAIVLLVRNIMQEHTFKKHPELIKTLA